MNETKSDAKIVLITEDDSALGNALIEEFKSAGHHPHVIRNSSAALQEMKEIKPALVLVDIAIAPKGGYEFVEQKNKDSVIASIPTILFSRTATPVDARMAAGLGVREYVVGAPASAPDIVSAAKRHLAQVEVSSDGSAGGAAASIGKVKPKSALAGKTVLWIEDDKFLADILTKKFASVGCNIVRVKTGEEGFAFLEKNVPQAILLDVLLPGMSGFDILQKIKMDQALRSVPVVILSNTSQTSDLEKSKMLGAQKFLVKATVSLDEIIREVGALVK